MAGIRISQSPGLPVSESCPPRSPLALFSVFSYNAGLMSYRSIKHMLGETSLERKCRFLFGAYLLLLITASFWFYGWLTNQIIDKQNHDRGRQLVDLEMAVRHWKCLEAASPNSENKTVAQVLSDAFSRQHYTVRFILPNHPVVKDGGADQLSPCDAFESDAVKRFLATDAKKTGDADDEFEERKSPAGNEYYYYQPIRGHASPVLCRLSPTA